MKNRTRFAVLTALLPLAAACGSSEATKTTQNPQNPTQTQAQPTADQAETAVPLEGDAHAKLVAAIARPSRPAAERARDAYRHPLETLEFFGIKDDMHVVELAAGTGWYTAILAPYLRDKGHLTITLSDPNGPPDKESTKNAKKLMERLHRAPGLFDKVEPKVVTATSYDLGPEGSADMVVTFRSIHGWLRDDGKPFKMVLEAVHKVLKPGGVLGVVEHRAKPDADRAKVFKSGYVPEPEVIELIEAAGFKLDGKSEVNANPKDTKDYDKGVWALPPTLEHGDKDRDKYMAIGESDRMTLKFVKK